MSRKTSRQYKPLGTVADLPTKSVGFAGKLVPTGQLLYRIQKALLKLSQILSVGHSVGGFTAFVFWWRLRLALER